MTEYIYHNDNNILIAGVDESNRGGLIYDVVAACVVFPNSFDDEKYKAIKDSKKLSAKKRRELAEYIKQTAITYGIGTASREEIDNSNILKATMKAMYRAINEAYKKHSFQKILIDGTHFNGYIPPGIDSEALPHECIIKGDAKYLNIAAASILAKDYHDTSFIELIDKNPELEKYDLRNNQGYGTPKHLAAIKKYGITQFHRKTFSPCNLYT
uniref:Ribonuclease HII n=1 Tax=viral metagenome TaxID=1070528 RepID=A0A6C0J237_9ZZZZ